MAIDLESMSRKQLEKLLVEVQSALKTVGVKERREAKKAAEKAAAKFGFTLAELTSAGKGKAGAKSPGAPKYVNPADADQTWTGKGRQPKWFKDAIDAGTDPSKLEI